MSNQEAKTWWLDVIGKLGVPLFILIVILYGLFRLGALAVTEIAKPAVEAWISDRSQITQIEIETRRIEGQAALEVAASVSDMADSMRVIKDIHNPEEEGD